MTSSSPFPPPSPNEPYITLSALKGGSITLPEDRFIKPARENAGITVPSMSFLITHPSFTLPSSFTNPSHIPSSAKQRPIHVLFDLGLRKDISRYDPPQQKHLDQRRPLDLAPGVAADLKHLSSGQTTADHVDLVILSHVHYDHHGDPEDFPNAQIAIGSGGLKVTKEGLGGLASHQHFQKDMLPEDRTWELPAPGAVGDGGTATGEGGVFEGRKWQKLGPFEAAMDLVRDGSIWVVDSPGHLPGHVSLLCRVGKQRWALLVGDCCHDRRILTGEREVGTWDDGHGHEMCIHLDRKKAEESIADVKRLMKMAEEAGDHLEVILAHDWEWWEDARKKGWAFPGHMS